MRDTIFISHSNPEDNDYARWLATRLQLAGYKVWCDVLNLIGGEKHWDDIQIVLDNNAAKFLLIESNTTFSKEGVLDEFDHAKNIAKQHQLKDFIVPIRIEDTPYNARIGLTRYNHIDSIGYWAKGLKKLIEKIQKDNVPQRSDKESIYLPEFNNQHIFESGIFRKKEVYYSNLWKIEKLPKYIYLYKYNNKDIADTVRAFSSKYPVIRHGNIIVTFCNSIDVDLPEDNSGLIKDLKMSIKPESVNRLTTSKIIKGYRSNEFPSCTDARNLLKILMNHVFHLLMENRRLINYEMSGSMKCYYYQKDTIPKDKVTIFYPNSKKSKQLIGKHLGDYWHFGISATTKTFPFPCYCMRSHIVFSSDGHNIWQDVSKLHTERRKKGKRWFNEEWRDQLMAFLASLKNEDNTILLPLCQDHTVKMPLLTFRMKSIFGYKELQFRQ